jgi:hypothetical protein
VNFTRAQQQKRLESFLSFLEKQHLSQYEVLSERHGGRSFIVHNSESDLAKIDFGLMGGIRLTARNGRLKELLRAWIAQERPSYDDRTSPEDFAELDTFRYLLSPSLALAPGGTIQLIPADHPLVELAEQLGYQIYLAFSEEPGATASRYHIVNPQGGACDGNDLVHTLARLLQQDLAR